MSDFVVKSRNTGEYLCEYDKKGGRLFCNSLEEAKPFDYNKAHRLEHHDEELIAVRLWDIAIEMERALKNVQEKL